ncbi:MAG: glycosyltransferase family 39 protein [Candidatus Omnitrophota bacterium]
MINKLFTTLIVLLILAVNILRFWQLDQVPYGFNVDELSGSVTIQCMETEGVDAHLIPHPIFADQHYGTPKPPVYTYPAVLWEKIFGHTADRLRAFTAFGNVLAILGLFVLTRMLFCNSYALLVTLIASLSPWIWGLSRIGYESTFCNTFIIWGIFFFLRKDKWLDKIIAGFLFACAMYVYPPERLHVPLLLVPLFIFHIIKYKRLQKGPLTGFILTLILSCIPLVQYTLWGNLQERFNGLSIFNNEFLKSVGKTNNPIDLANVFFHNFSLHFSPRYLFITGDPSWEHSTQHFGLLGWVDILGLAALVFILLFRFKDILPDKWWLIFILANFLIGIIPASLTNSGLPSSLRTVGAFPFSCLLTGYGLWMLCRRWKIFFPVAVLLGCLFSFMFLKTYFTLYPEESKGWFGFWTKEEALNAKTDKDWMLFMVHYQDQDYHFRYYLMNYHGDTCTSSRVKWQKLREVLKLPKIY